jgi:hypothetical protein
MLPADALSAALARDLAARRAFRRHTRKRPSRATHTTQRNDQIRDGDVTHTPVKHRPPSFL